MPDPKTLTGAGTEAADREAEHRSGYGGSGGQPTKSSDQRQR
jgi:hypothetical protein